MNEKEKRLEVLKRFLDENRVKYELNHECKKSKDGSVADLYVSQYRIAVHLSDGNDQAFFESTKRSYKPFFVRDEETDEFLLEKMANCIDSQIGGRSPRKAVRKGMPARRRVRIPVRRYEKVEPNRR